MEFLNLTAILITLTALFSYINNKLFRLPTTIGVMLIALLASLGLIGISELGLYPAEELAAKLFVGFDFNTTLMHGMLSFLLFAGALKIDINDLAQQKWVVTLLATFGILISTAVVGVLSFWVLNGFGLNVPLIYCFLFGALISPTDPVAVLAIIRSAGLSKSLETKIAGESLFNDGVAVVVFLVLFGIATRPTGDPVAEIGLLFAQEAIGGAVFGLVIGYLAYRLLASIDNYQVEILITLALVMGGYALANHLHLSGPIAMVVSGLLIGNHGRSLAMSESTREHLDTFWELIDEILNAVLFVLIGLEVLLISFVQDYLVAGLLMIPIVLLTRFVSVGVPISLLRLKRQFSPHVVKILVWGGLRGGISVALALSLPAGQERDVLIAVTYIVVVFSVLVQGLTIGPVVRRMGGRDSM